jgi:hypothetical protein
MRTVLMVLIAASAWAQQAADYRAEFQVRYVATGSVYLAGGREEGLQEGFRLTVKHREPGAPLLSAQTVASIVVVAIAAHSAVCEIESSDGQIQVGDSAEVARQDLDIIQSIKQSTTARRYAQIVTFTNGDPLEDEQRAASGISLVTGEVALTASQASQRSLAICGTC